MHFSRSEPTSFYVQNICVYAQKTEVDPLLFHLREVHALLEKWIHFFGKLVKLKLMRALILKLKNYG